MNVTVVGLGYVGLVSAAGLATRGHTVVGLDADPMRIAMLRTGALPFFEPHLEESLAEARAGGRVSFTGDAAAAVSDADIVLVAVGTHGPNGEWQTRTIQQVLASIVPLLPDTSALVVRSTLPPDYVDELRSTVRRVRRDAGRPAVPVLLNPEFTREGSAVADFLHPERIVLGAVDDPAGDGVAALRQLYAGFSAPILEMTGPDACLAKLGSNLFLATKISFANELARLCDRYGAQVDQVVGAMALDPRIGGSFLRPGVGFGGSCLPHQVAMTVQTLAEEGEHLPLLAAVDAVNRGQRDRCVVVLQELLGDLEGRRIALLGIAFKPQTDDIREAPSIDIAAQLTALGASVVAYDPMPAARANAAVRLPGVTMVDSPFDALVDADAAVVVTEWPQITDLAWTKVAAVMRTPIVIDGRNALDESVMTSPEITYVGFGRGVAPATATPVHVAAGTPGATQRDVEVAENAAAFELTEPVRGH